MKYLETVRAFNNTGITLFTTKEFGEIAGLSQGSAWAALARYVKKGLIESPKRGLFYFADNPPHEFLLANKLYIPSYVSFETALSYYSLIPEVVYSITSATTKITREFIHQGKNFKYLKIKRAAYTGYFKKEDYLIADPEKALVDYLYFVALGKKKLNERLNTSKLDIDKAKEYTRLFVNKKLNQLIKRLS